MVCMTELRRTVAKDLGIKSDIRQFYASIMAHMNSAEFHPAESMDESELKSLFSENPHPPKSTAWKINHTERWMRGGVRWRFRLWRFFVFGGGG